ncbi:MAG: glycosyl hydrolase family protein, partial [Frankiales bacterium]|nr:glycosyl hydrolase family protein [Frankiales bacterium]
RRAYTTEALRSLRAAMADGVDVRGYFHWSLLDNYEWGRFGPTFGLVAVDRTSFERHPKPSLSWLGALGPRPPH